MVVEERCLVDLVLVGNFALQENVSVSQQDILLGLVVEQLPVAVSRLLGMGLVSKVSTFVDFET